MKKDWFIHESDNGGVYVMTGKPGYNVCEMQNRDKLENARLICAAPAMLDMLKHIASVNYGQPAGVIVHTVEKINALISEIEGEAGLC